MLLNNFNDSEHNYWYWVHICYFSLAQTNRKPKLNTLFNELLLWLAKSNIKIIERKELKTKLYIYTQHYRMLH